MICDLINTPSRRAVQDGSRFTALLMNSFLITLLFSGIECE